jgi:peptidoglycan/xylan/chitin deacetylase (PgdA/CDA1 family)
MDRGSGLATKAARSDDQKRCQTWAAGTHVRLTPRWKVAARDKTPGYRTVMGWPDRHQAAISLSFDDARPSQLSCGLPLLDRLGVPATFFVLPDAVARTKAEWGEVLARGHEIGNHTLTHPCSANFAWSRGNALERMTVADFRAEVSEANLRLRKLLGIEPTVFAYPCGHTFVGRGRRTQSLVPLIAEMFEVGRTFNDVVANSPAGLDPAQTSCVNSDKQTFEVLLPTLEAAVADRGWLVLGGHEIGYADDPEATSVETIAAVVNWCRNNGVWIDTIGNVARVAATFKTT